MHFTKFSKSSVIKTFALVNKFLHRKIRAFAYCIDVQFKSTTIYDYETDCVTSLFQIMFFMIDHA